MRWEILARVRLGKALHGKLRTDLFPTVPGSQIRFASMLIQ